MLLVVGGALAAVRVIKAQHLDQTAVLFIGVPTFLAMALVLVIRPRTGPGMVFLGVTLALLLAMPCAGEGFVCVLMAAPLFFVVALVVSVIWIIIDHERNRDRDGRYFYALGVVPLLLASLEGTTPQLSFERAERVVVERVVPATPAQVAAAMAETPRFDQALPWFVHIGFPKPVAGGGGGLEVGATRVIHYAGGEGQPGGAIWQVTHSEPGRAVFRCTHDASHIAHWMRWRTTEFTWEAAPGGTRVRVAIRYDRLLDPAWYFGPVQRGAVSATAEHLILAQATPAHVVE